MSPVIPPTDSPSAAALSKAPRGEALPAEGLPAGASRHVPAARTRTSSECVTARVVNGASPRDGAVAGDSLVAHDPAALAHAIRDAALALGFARVGFCPIEPFAEATRAFEDWLGNGHHGEMTFMVGNSRGDPSTLLPRAKTLIVVALAYDRGAPDSGEREPGLLPPSGLVARYARGQDYHGLMKERLRRLADRCAELAGRPVVARPCVDTAPLLEREAARRAGLGFTAKNTMLIAPGLGSYVLLGELLLDLEVAPSAPVAAGCGSCRTCLDACPTAAFLDAYTLDARRCISYLTIELRGAIPRELRPAIGRWVFGCDICQEVCPFNRSAKPRPVDPALAARPGTSTLELCALLTLGSAAHRRLVKNSALKRINRASLQRNAAVALGNTGEPGVVPALAEALASNPNALVRGHVAWALGRIGTEAARRALVEARAQEKDASVVEEIDLAHTEASRHVTHAH